MRGEMLMNIDKIGKFIAICRKKQKLTQEQLSEKLNISNRAISKWERGICLPDASIMIPLCEILKINVNELLSGELLNEKEYNKKAEELLIKLKQQEEAKDKIIFYSAYFFTFISFILFLLICFIANCFISDELTQVIIILVATFFFFISCLYAVKIESLVGYHECKICHHKHKPTYKEILWAMHMGTRRYLRCPKCNKKSWNKKVISK